MIAKNTAQQSRMKIEDKAKQELSLEPAAWAAELHSHVPWCEPEVLRTWLAEWLELLYCEAEASFADKVPTDRALRAKLKGMLLIRLRGPQTKAWLQGHTAELRAKRENDAIRETRFRPSAEDYARLQVGYISSSEGDSEGPSGDDK